MSIRLANFQLDAIRQLMEGMVSDKREIVLKSCTGSGKTIILTYFMNEYIKCYDDVVFVWLTPGKGELENQSKKKMDKYIHGASTKELLDIMTSGFSASDFCFINWEKLTKKGNNALKEGERANFIDWTERAHDDGLRFVVIVDESHQNDTIKADEIIELFKTDKIIRCSATPKPYPKAFNIDIPEEDVIAEGLIKKVLVINEDFAQNISVDDQVSYLLEKAIEKQRLLHSEFLQREIRVNPLIIVQLPNKSDLLLDGVERYFEKQGITYENGQLAIWMSERKQNLEDIEAPNAKPIAVIIKQAIATGWDCPRAQLLVKLRDNMSETFEIQTIGRIRRMPEAKHYGSDLLDSCYLYTLDEKFTEGIKQSLGKGALDGLRLTLKSEHRLFSIITEYKTDVPFPRDAKLALRVIKKYFEKTYSTDGKTLQNQTRLEAHGYIFSSEVVDYAKSGSVNKLTREQFSELNTINIHAKLDTHKHGRDFHHCAAEIGLKITLDYNSISTILQRLFTKVKGDSTRILSLEWRDFYAFVINNKGKLKDDIAIAMADETLQLEFKVQNITEKPMGLPQAMMFFYDQQANDQTVMSKNVYHGYLSSAEVRSASERLFEQYCETSAKIKWFYKNGDKGLEFFSIVYEDNFGKQKSFYPDYIVEDINGGIWIIETKGGFTRSGQSEDIDEYTAKKFNDLKRYLKKYNKLGGVVRQDKQSQKLCICTDNYSDDIHSDSWRLLSDIL
ncbi:MAG: DEAD/DEAH box helicase family protein [Defluviitaleaceae bacterium]|nr:DEAD/DEAH box helicase family protein [Defluviitaleaceae bacterium]